MNQNTLKRIYGVLTEYETRRAAFTPAWRPDPYLSVESPTTPEILLATWSHQAAKRVLAVVSNVSVDSTETVRLRWAGAWQPAIADAMTDRVVPVVDGRLAVELGPESFVLLGVDAAIEPGNPTVP
jgi:hypothetical protein